MGHRARQAPLRAASERPRKKILLAVCALLVVAAGAVMAPAAWTKLKGGATPSGQLSIQSDPAGAEVLLDGKPAGRTPATLEAVAGQHQVELRAGGASRAAWVTVAANRTTVHKVALADAVLRGALHVVTNPPGAVVLVDGQDHGKSPTRIADLVPGVHRVQASGPFGPVEQEVTVEGGATASVTVATVGWVKVRAPYPLQVSEQGRRFGETSGQALMVPAGRHRFDLVNASLALKVRQFVNVPAGTVVTMPFDPPMGMINFAADDTAEVWLDGASIGRTPLMSVPVPLGSHEVVFRHERLGEVRYTVNVTLAAPVRLSVTFNKK